VELGHIGPVRRVPSTTWKKKEHYESVSIFEPELEFCLTHCIIDDPVVIQPRPSAVAIEKNVAAAQRGQGEKSTSTFKPDPLLNVH
jgi:hypothetical protein